MSQDVGHDAPPTLTDLTAVQVQDLVKTYPKATTNALDHVSLEIRRGEIFGLLGPNGAGKSTLIGILTTAVAPTSGIARVAGLDVADSGRLKPRIAVVPQNNNLDRSLRAREVLTFHAAYHGVPKAEREARADELLEELGLADRAAEKSPRFSGGMAQRLMLARALMHDPEVLFLDEPTNNLDPQTRHFLWDRIRQLHTRGVTIVLTTHDMTEAEQLCDRIAIVDHGRVLVLDTQDELKKMVPGGSLLQVHVGGATPGLAERLRGLDGVQQVDVTEPSEDAVGDPVVHRLYSADVALLVPDVIRAVGEHHGTVHDLRVSTPSLETVFIHLTGRNLRG